MILDTIDHADKYAAFGPVWAKAMSILKNYDPASFQRGKQDMGDGIFLAQFEYQSKPMEKALMEAHRKYADIMFMTQGEEKIFYKPAAQLSEITMPYDEAQDALLAKLDEDALAIPMRPGQFLIFLPQDGHGPGIALEESQTVRRVVIKVPLD